MKRIQELFGIQYPIIQAGMIWCSGWKLASAVSQAGGLGLIGAGSMYPEVLKHHIKSAKAQLNGKPFGVNIPLLYPDIEAHMKTVVEEKVPIVFTSAGNPATWTSYLKDHGIKVVHVIANSKFALKAEKAGVDALVAEGFEAGGHNGREETTTLCLIPIIKEVTSLPIIAAGGIGSGRAILATLALGAEGFQIGSLFAATQESSAHPEFKNRIVESKEGETLLSLKKLTPVRLLANEFAATVQKAEAEGADNAVLADLLGKGRAKKGMFEGDLDQGELEIGQIAACIREIPKAGDLVRKLWADFMLAKTEIQNL